MRTKMIFTSDFVYEIPLSFKGYKKIMAKKDGMQKAFNDARWSPFVPYNKGQLILTTEKGQTINYVEVQGFEGVCDSIITNNKSADTYSFFEILNFNQLFSVLNVNCKERKEIKIKSSSIYLPLTSAHGDLHIGNIIKNKNGGYRLIDWEYFQENNSYVLDIIHLYVRKECEEINDSWVNVIKGINFNKYKKIIDLMNRFSITSNQVKFAYVLNRAILELNKQVIYKGDLSNQKRTKYIKAIDYALSL
ncbi:phosphotransferase family protein [Alkalicoccus chagannorensis]|uniref:phosphotransferase family protein n=1 Tax=Alkalicoccus chagannorensis TaxID=427072 RepID=UPI001FE071E5|nr:hypothetical protein [Alkalicoccus chagannorensis]